MGRERTAPGWAVAVLSLALLAVGLVALGVGYGACNENPDVGSRLGRQVCDDASLVDLVAVAVVPALFLLVAFAVRRAWAAVLIIFTLASVFEALIIGLFASAAQ